MVEPQPSKLVTWVRFPSPALWLQAKTTVLVDGCLSIWRFSMKSKNKKVRKLNQRAQAIAEQIAYESAVSNTFVFCMERGLLCTVLLNDERWTQRHIWRVINVSREFVYCLLADNFQYSGFTLHRISDIAAVSPAPELTEHYHLRQVQLPESVPDLSLDSLQTAISGISRLDTLLHIGHIGKNEDTSALFTCHIEKVGKKKLSLRSLDIHDLSWAAQPSKLSYEDLDFITFSTPYLIAFEQLAMPYDAYIRSLNESLNVPQNTEDFEVGSDLLEVPSEDMIDYDDLADMVSHEDDQSDESMDI